MSETGETLKRGCKGDTANGSSREVTAVEEAGTWDISASCFDQVATMKMAAKASQTLKRASLRVAVAVKVATDGWAVFGFGRGREKTMTSSMAAMGMILL